MRFLAAALLAVSLLCSVAVAQGPFKLVRRAVGFTNGHSPNAEIVLFAEGKLAMVDSYDDETSVYWYNPKDLTPSSPASTQQNFVDYIIKLTGNNGLVVALGTSAKLASFVISTGDVGPTWQNTSVDIQTEWSLGNAWGTEKLALVSYDDFSGLMHVGIFSVSVDAITGIKNAYIPIEWDHEVFSAVIGNTIFVTGGNAITKFSLRTMRAVNKVYIGDATDEASVYFTTLTASGTDLIVGTDAPGPCMAFKWSNANKSGDLPSKPSKSVTIDLDTTGTCRFRSAVAQDGLVYFVRQWAYSADNEWFDAGAYQVRVSDLKFLRNISSSVATFEKPSSITSDGKGGLFMGSDYFGYWDDARVAAAQVEADPEFAYLIKFQVPTTTAAPTDDSGALGVAPIAAFAATIALAILALMF